MVDDIYHGNLGKVSSVAGTGDYISDWPRKCFAG